ncbi:hypothetical protein B4R02_27455, partial [Salmonella enterica subsp. diarizonae serovar 42:l,v:1,5,7]|nr:hypothetical protein [Salmonella enterica subsp. diarizonae serovar 42:l,v:1,5,7]
KETKMNTQQVNFSSLYFGTPVAIVSSQNADNADIVLNIPDARLWEHVEAMADTTGKEHVPNFKQKMGYRSEKK